MQLGLDLTGRTCGGCVHRNARPLEETGYCTPGDERRHRDAPACEQWFGLDQLIAATAKQGRAR